MALRAEKAERRAYFAASMAPSQQNAPILSCGCGCGGQQSAGSGRGSVVIAERLASIIMKRLEIAGPKRDRSVESGHASSTYDLVIIRLTYDRRNH